MLHSCLHRIFYCLEQSQAPCSSCCLLLHLLGFEASFWTRSRAPLVNWAVSCMRALSDGQAPICLFQDKSISQLLWQTALGMPEQSSYDQLQCKDPCHEESNVVGQCDHKFLSLHGKVLEETEAQACNSRQPIEFACAMLRPTGKGPQWYHSNT